MDFSLSSLAAGFLFGVIGLYLLRYGKQQAHVPSILIGFVLMAYPYFVATPWLLWSIGGGLVVVAYRLLRSG